MHTVCMCARGYVAGKAPYKCYKLCLYSLAKILQYHLVWFESEISSHKLTSEQLASHCGTILHDSILTIMDGLK